MLGFLIIFCKLAKFILIIKYQQRWYYFYNKYFKKVFLNPFFFLFHFLENNHQPLTLSSKTLSLQFFWHYLQRHLHLIQRILFHNLNLHTHYNVDFIFCLYQRFQLIIFVFLHLIQLLYPFLSFFYIFYSNYLKLTILMQ